MKKGGTFVFSLLSGISFFISPVLSLIFSLPLIFYYFPEKLLFYLVPLYPLMDFFVRRTFTSISSIWDEGFLILLFLILLIRIKRKSVVFTEIINPVLLFLFFLSLSLLKSNIPLSAGIDGIRSYLEMFLFFIVVVNFISNKEDIRKIIDISLVSVTLVSIYAIYQFIVKVPIPPSWVDKDLEMGIATRAFSIFTSPNALAGYLILILPLVFILFLNEKGIRKYVYLFVTLVSLSALLFTLTRAAWLSIFLALFIFTLIYKDKRIFFLLVILVISSYFVPQIRTRFMNLLSPVYMEKARTYGRIYRWNLAIDIFKRNPLFGVGPGGFGGAVASRIGFFEGIYVDNYYLKTLVETGIFGFVSFLHMIFTIIKRGIATVVNRNDGFLKSVALGITFGIIAFLINNVTENLWEVVPLSAGMWTLAGILFSIRRIND